MSYFVSYTSDQGVTLGATSDSMVGALALIADEFGEDFIHLFAHAKQELSDQIGKQEGDVPEQVKDDLYQQLRTVGVDDVGPVEGTVPPSDHVPAGGEIIGGGRGSGSGSSVPVTDPANSGSPVSGTSDPAPSSSSPRNDTGPSTDVQRCLVCGETISQEMANVSKLMYGEERCNDCFAF